MDSPSPSRSRLAVHPLEDRCVPALLINDVNFPGLPVNDTQQYFEIRGTAGETAVPGRTYLVVVSGEPGTGNRPGTINAVFDLGGAALGSDGYLSVVQANSPYSFLPGTNVLRGTTTGFGGLDTPDRFSDNSTLSNRFEFIFGTNTFLLVSALTPPVPNGDVDFNNDGLLDGAASTWTVLDSVGAIGTFTGATANQIGYGRINFSEVPPGSPPLGRVPAGSTLVAAANYDYAGRVGESTGSAATDWVAGLPRGAAPGAPLRLENSILGRPSDPHRFTAGLRTDNLGTSNFVSLVEGRVFTDANGNGVFDPGEAGVAGQTVWADQNPNGLLDSYETTFSAASLPVGAELTNAIPGVTLTTQDPTGTTVARDTRVTSPGFSNTSYIGSNNVGFFTQTLALRMDFYRPASAVSIDFFGSSPLSDVFGRLEVYAADGTLLDTYLSPATRGSLPYPGVNLAITRPSADIAYAIAYPDPSGFTFTYFDNLRFTTPEASGVTDATGRYKVGGLIDGTYSIRTIGGAQLPATITNLVPVRNVNFGTGGGLGGGGGGGGATGGRGRTLSVGGGPGAVSVYGAVNGQLSQASVINFPVLFPDAPFDGTYRTATGDVNGDAIEDVVVVTGPGTPVRWGVIDGRTGSTLLVPLSVAFTGSDDFTGGGFVSVGDLDADGRAEVVITPDQGGGPRVTVFSVYPVGARVRGNYLGIADPNFRGGARTALGDVNGDGRADLLVAAGFQGGPRVALYDGRLVLSGTLSRLTTDFFAFDPSLRNGVFASIGDVNGDGFGDLVIGAGSGGAPAVRVLSGRTLITGGGPGAALASPLADYFVNGDTDSRTGVRVATKNVDGDSRADVIAASGEGQPSLIRVYPGANVTRGGEPAALQDIDPFGVALTEGVFVG